MLNHKQINVLLLITLILLFFVLNQKQEDFFSNKKNSYSQIGQDLKVLKYFNNKKNGYFIEVGAVDGIELSNTYLLEKDYNWKGICIEPVPSFFKKLVKNRKSINLSDAVYNVNNKIVNITEASLLSGIREDIDAHKEVLKNKENKDIKVKTKTLTKILDENKAPKYIDYLSIDTEGSELKILEGIDFDKYSFGYINIEHNGIEPRRTLMKKKLLNNGYQYIGQNKFDDIYIKKK